MHLRFLPLSIVSISVCSAFTSSPLRTPLCRITSTPRSPLILSSEVADTVDDVPSDVEEVEEVPIIADENVINARNEVLYLAKSLAEKSPTGIFLTTLDSISKLTKATAELEAVAPPSFTKVEQDLSIGDWELVCTTRKPTRGLPSEPTKLSLPFNLPKPPSPSALQDSVRKSISVVQRIKTSEETTDVIDRVDNVIEYTPLSLTDVIPEDSPLKAIRGWNVNPLEVSKSKVTLIHKADVESLTPVYRTKIGLKSVVVTVAGTSQYLEPEGADVLGLNIPSVGDFLNSGTFDTTFVDENVRISRGKIAGVIDELRVFIRKGSSVEDILGEDYQAPAIDDGVDESPKKSPVVNERIEAVSKAFSGVVDAVDTLDKNVRSSVQNDAQNVTKAVVGVRESIEITASNVRGVVKEDIEVISKAVEEVRSAVIGETKESEEVTESTDEIVAEVEEVVEETEEINTEVDEDEAEDTEIEVEMEMEEGKADEESEEE